MNGESTRHDQNIWENELLTVSEVAAYLRVGRVTVWRWCKQGHLRAIQVGHHWRIHRDDLRCLLDPAQSGPPALDCPSGDGLFPPLPDTSPDGHGKPQGAKNKR